MSDVEKYGLFAVVFVGGLLLIIATQGGFEDGAVSASGAEIVEGVPSLNAAASKPDTLRVKIPEFAPEERRFDWNEAPLGYNGPRAHRGPPAVEEQLLEATADSGEPGVHVVAKGDTLQLIAKRYLGTTARWKELAALNPGVDPRKLMPGDRIRVAGAAPAPPRAQPEPAASTASDTKASGPRQYVVKKGDTLGGISQAHYGTVRRADEIYAANRDVLRSKDDLKIGQTLRIP